MIATAAEEAILADVTHHHHPVRIDWRNAGKLFSLPPERPQALQIYGPMPLRISESITVAGSPCPGTNTALLFAERKATLISSPVLTSLLISPESRFSLSTILRTCPRYLLRVSRGIRACCVGPSSGLD